MSPLNACSACSLPSFCGPTGPAGLVTPSSFFRAQLSQVNGVVPLTTTTEPIIFNAVTGGNLDAAYDVVTGIYTAPRAGFYVFDVNVVINNAIATLGRGVASLTVNGIATNSQEANVIGTIGQVSAITFSSLLLLSSADQVQVTGRATVVGNLTLGSNVYPIAASSTFQCKSLF